MGDRVESAGGAVGRRVAVATSAIASPQGIAIGSGVLPRERRGVEASAGPPRIVLGIGTGRCGTLSLARLLDRQPGWRVTHEQVPLLPWEADGRRALIAARFERLRRQRGGAVVGDVASFYLPYLDEAFELEPTLRVICLERPRAEVIDSFIRWLDAVEPLPTNHWSAAPAEGVYHNPVWSQVFPKYDDADLANCLERYWEEYHERVVALEGRHPQRVRRFPTEVLNTEVGVRELLAFAGVSERDAVVQTGLRANQPAAANSRRRPESPPGDPRKCVVLVPYQTHIVPRCEQGLKELERRGYAVRRVSGYANIDQGRSQMATDALWDGFEETLWIDSDVGFDADDVDKLRRHGLPIVCGIYPKKGQRSLAAHVVPGTKQLVFGAAGGLTELHYAATGFLLVRRRVYETIQQRLRLPLCNERFGKPMVPFFEPQTIRDADGHWNLGEDYAFCHRARECGYAIMADTSIRLWHYGTYGFSWEDAGIDRERFGTFSYRLTDGE